MQATEAFAAGRQKYPKYSTGDFSSQGGMEKNVCPFVEILPFIGQGSAYEKFQPQIATFDGLSISAAGGANAELMYLTIPLYQCPSDRSQMGSCNYRANLGTGADYYTSPPTGPFSECFDPNNANGAFVLYRQISPKDFRDGLSNTVMYSERVIGDGNSDEFDPWRDYSPVSDAWPHCTGEGLRATCRGIAGIAPVHASYLGFTWLYATKAHTAYDHILSPNSLIPDCAHMGQAGINNSAITARSQHPGIVIVAMGDGSVRPVSEHIDLHVWQSMGSRSGLD